MLIYSELVYVAVEKTGQGMKVMEYTALSSADGYKEKILEQEHPRFVGQCMIAKQISTPDGIMEVPDMMKFPIKADSLYEAFEKFGEAAQEQAKKIEQAQRRIIAP